MKKIFFSALLLCASLFSYAQLTAPDAAATAPTLPSNQVKAIYSPTYSANCNFYDWGSGTTFVEDTYGKKFVIGTFGYFGLADFLLNCLTMEKLHADIWVAADASLGLVPIYGGAGLVTDDTHRQIVSLTGQQWNSIDLTLATDFAGLDLSSIYQFKVDNAAAGLTFWLANLYFYTEQAVAEDTEAPTNVQAALSSYDFYSATLTLSAKDNSGAVNFKIMNGAVEVGSGAAASEAEVKVTAANLVPGTAYNLDVIASDETGNIAPAVTVIVTTLAAPDPAPVPALAAENVKALYSDAYTPVAAVTNYCEWWWQSPTLAQKTLGSGDNVLYYVTPQDGVFGWAFPSTDFSGFQKVHLSVYPLAAAPFEIYPVIAPEADFHKASETLVPNQWNEVVLDYTDKDFVAMTQLGFVNKSAMVAFFLDNVYFFKDADETGLNNVESAGQIRKVVEDGVVYIIRDGVRYTVTGQAVR